LSRSAAYVLGYHGCPKEIGEKAVNGQLELLRSENAYDWLGWGTYFWEGDADRALNWAISGGHTDPFVVGAVIDLRECLDLLVLENLDLLTSAYNDLAATCAKAGEPLPKNKDVRDDDNQDKLLRELDCAVINHLHYLIETRPEGGEDDIPPFDTVRGLFVEGPPVYPGARLYRKSHTQIAVRNLACIKGLFIPR